MANSITGINDDIISQAGFMAFNKKMTPANAFSRNFSADAAKKGDKVSVFRETYPADAVQTKTSHGAYTIQDADSDAVEISLGEPKYVSWGLDDVEVHSSSVLELEKYGRGKGNHLATGILQDIWSEITNANFGAAGFTGAASTFDLDDVFDLADALDDADAPEEGRSLVLSNAYYTALLKDVHNNFNAGEQPEREGALARLAGFDIFKSNIIPANGENLVGFACVPDAMALGVRYLMPQEGNTYRRAERLTDPGGSGLTIGLRDWYDNDSGVRKRVLECVYGYETGNANALVRLVSA